MATTIKQVEGAPAFWPSTVPLELSDAADDLDPEIVWCRIESYTAIRFVRRDVEWIVEGPGEWCPPLAPAEIVTVEVWSRAGEYEAVELIPSPLGGYLLPCTGPYRFTGTVGEGTESPVIPPAEVLEAYRRLAEYMVADAGKAGASSENEKLGEIGYEYSRSPKWLANAMQNSGAGDLLRLYRRA